MGSGASATTSQGGGSLKRQLSSTFKMIPDKYRTFDELTVGLRKAGLEKSQLIVGIDFTKSNLWKGKKSFGGRCLHDVTDPAVPNPYLQALNIISKALWNFDDDHMIPAYGFGDAQTGSHSVFSFEDKDVPCKGLTGCEKRYKEIAAEVSLSGPTSFAPLINQAIKLVRETNEYHILLIVADGQVSTENVQATTKAIVEASHYALSIVMVGVGDGPWDLMEKFDDELPERRFDNFQFVDFNALWQKYPKDQRDVAFATHALMEVPEQYCTIKKMRLLDNRHGHVIHSPQYPSVLVPPTNARYREMTSDLPGDWQCAWCPKNKRHYYVSWELRQTQWEKPAKLGVHKDSKDALPPLPSSPTSHKDGKVALPPIPRSPVSHCHSDKRSTSRASLYSTSTASTAASSHSLESCGASYRQRTSSTAGSVPIGVASTHSPLGF